MWEFSIGRSIELMVKTLPDTTRLTAIAHGLFRAAFELMLAPVNAAVRLVTGARLAGGFVFTSMLQRPDAAPHREGAGGSLGQGPGINRQERKLDWCRPAARGKLTPYRG